MKGSLIKLMGTSALVAALSIPVAVAAASQTRSAASVNARGVVTTIDIGNPARGAQKAFGLVNSQGQVLVLRMDNADRAAYTKATEAAGKDDFVRVSGVSTTYDGMPAVRVQKTSVE